MLQKFPLLLAHLKTGNTSEDLLDKIWHIFYSFYKPKQISKKYTIIYLFNLQHEMKNLNYLINFIHYQVFRAFSYPSSRRMKYLLIIHQSKYTSIELRTAEQNYIQVKTGYYLELLIPKTMKLSRSNERKITKMMRMCHN